jgi:transcriptional regulator GlxA family with amidase domain
LLQESDFPIEKIAEQVGYVHPRNFSHAFRRHFGVPPRVARRRLRQQ